MNQNQFFLDKAVEIAIENKKLGGRPFGAVLVHNDEIVSLGVNEMLNTFDPSSHAEMEAIRKFTMTNKSFDLSGYKIYASGQPCPMCLAAMAFLNINDIFYAFDNEDATPFNLSSQKVYDKLNIKEITNFKIQKIKTKYSIQELYA